MLDALEQLGRGLQREAQQLRATFQLDTHDAQHKSRNAWANWRVDFNVQRNGDIGSPRDPSSTISSSITNKSGSKSILRLRPPPGRRTRSDGPAPPASSLAPTINVFRARPDASATRR